MEVEASLELDASVDKSCGKSGMKWEDAVLFCCQKVAAAIFQRFLAQNTELYSYTI